MIFSDLRRSRYLSLLLLLLAVLLFILPTFSANAAEVKLIDLGAYKYVEEKRAKVLGTPGCIERPIEVRDDGKYADIGNHNPTEMRKVSVPDVLQAPPGTVILCTTRALEGFTDRLVKQAALEKKANTCDKLNFGCHALVGLRVGLYQLLRLIGGLGLWLLSFTSFLLGLLLDVRQFITHPFVQSGWPFVQGIANLGFILALLYIAFATTLRLDIGGGIRRLLPRLLIAALLINFSLIIGAIFIDASRLLMAVMFNAVADQPCGEDIPDPKLRHIGACILNKSDLFNKVFKETTVKGSDVVWLSFTDGFKQSWENVDKLVVAVFTIWAFMLAIGVIAVGLFIRYIMLLLLLIISPMAYLAVALPNFSNLAAQWWSNFLKWVFYGPIALFILLLIVVITNAPILKGDSGLWAGTLTIIIVGALCIAAAKAGSALGAIGGGAIVGYATGAGRRAVRGGRWLGGKGYQATKYVGRKAGPPAGDYLARRTGVAALSPYYWRERNKQRQQRAARRERGAFGTQAAKRRYATPQQRADMEREQQWVNEARQAAQVDPNNAQNPALAHERLQSREVGRSLSEQQLRAVVDRAVYQGDNDEQINAIVQNPEAIANMSLDVRNVLTNEIRTRLMNPNITREEKDQAARWQNAYNANLREIDRRSQQGQQGGQQRGAQT